MKSYSALIQLKGSPHNQVRKDELSAAELLILAEIHQGEQAVLKEVKETGTLRRVKDPTGERTHKWDMDQERAWLIRTYGKDNFARVFPSQFTPLPQEYTGPLHGQDVLSEDELPLEGDGLPAILQPKKGAKPQAAALT